MSNDVIRSLLLSIGENPDREGLKETPRRVTAMLAELTAGYHQDPHQFATTFHVESNHDLITVASIPFYSLCEHHLAPFFGQAHIGYVPSDRILGLSKFARIVEVYAKRLQVQERLTQQIAAALEDILQPQALAVMIKAEHLCMSMRGVKKAHSQTCTEILKGTMITDEILLNRFHFAVTTVGQLYV